MNNLQLKTRVALNLANMQTAHPHYTEIQLAVNDAVREIPKRIVAKNHNMMGLFPELVRRATALTVADDSTLTLPVANMLIPLRMHCFQTATLPDEHRVRTWPVRYIDPEVYEYLPKTTKDNGWPRLWTRIGDDAKIWPTPDATYVSYMRLYYLMSEENMSADADAPTLKAQWHRAVTDYASFLMEVAMQAPTRAKLWLESCDQKLGSIIDIKSIMESQTNHELVAWDLNEMGASGLGFGGGGYYGGM